MNTIKSFNDYIEKKVSKEDIIDISKLEKLEDGEFTIVGIQDVSLDDPRINNPALEEAMIVNADLGGKEVKRGDVIWITALIKKNNYNINSMAVLKTRVSDMYNSLNVLNGLK